AFDSVRCDDKQTLDTIRRYYLRSLDAKEPYLLDPHTAIGVKASEDIPCSDGSTKEHFICLATAHPAKFSAAIEAPVSPSELEFQAVLPEEFVGLMERERRCTVVDRALRKPSRR